MKGKVWGVRSSVLTIRVLEGPSGNLCMPGLGNGAGGWKGQVSPWPSRGMVLHQGGVWGGGCLKIFLPVNHCALASFCSFFLGLHHCCWWRKQIREEQVSRAR